MAPTIFSALARTPVSHCFFKLIINRKVALTQSAQSGFLSQTHYAVGALKEGKGRIHLIEHEVRWLRSKVAIFHAWIDDYC